jgi:hypothetical protein
MTHQRRGSQKTKRQIAHKEGAGIRYNEKTKPAVAKAAVKFFLLSGNSMHA